jgi:pyrophosphate--fructose-6-phosphate 1-phosphotransferase
LQVQQLISELNEILAHDIVDEGGLWKKKLPNQSLQLFEFLPQAIQEQLMLERDPHENVQVFVSYILLVLFMIFD